MGEKNKIRILFIIDFLMGLGGTEKHLLQLVKNIDRKRFDCYLLAFQSDPEFLKNFEKHCHILPFSLNRIYDWKAFRLVPNLIRFLKERQIDIVQTFHFGADNYGSLVSKIARVPLIISSRRDLGTYRTRTRYRFFDHFTQRIVNSHLSVCNRVTESMVKSGILRKKITTIYNGIDLSEWPDSNGDLSGKNRKDLNISKSSFVIGNIAHFRPEKGHDVFFEAVRRLASQIPNLRVLALGDQGTRRKYFETLIQQDEILQEIVTVDHVQDVKKYLAVMDVVCLTPINNEGFSNALLEEMAAGRPIIATDVGGNAEAVVDGETGYIIPPNDVDALERAILKLYNNPELRKGMGQKGRKRVENHFTLEKMIQNIENYYLETLQEMER